MNRTRISLLAGLVLSGALPFAAQAADSAMTCQQMMDKASPMVSGMTDQKKMAMAQKEMDTAKSAMDAGKMKTCKTHMKKAMMDMGMKK